MTAPPLVKSGYTQFGLNCLATIGVSTITHPLSYVRVLVQIGYEPLPARNCKTWYGSPANCYPNFLECALNMKDEHGWLELYKGFVPKLLGRFVCQGVSHGINSMLNSTKDNTNSESGTQETNENSLNNFLEETGRMAIVSTASLLVSHPFHVISVRMMAQYVGKETYYSSISSALSNIIKDEGILGLFSGFIPLLFGELLTLVIVRTISYLSEPYLPAITEHFQEVVGNIPGKDVKSYTQQITHLSTSMVTYPLTVVSTMMVVNGTPLEGGNICGVIFGGWADCFKYLRIRGQLQRGASTFKRWVK